MKINDANLRNLQIFDNALVLFEPARHIRRLATTTADIYQHRALLKQIPYNKQVVGHLAQLIYRDLNNGRRFRIFDCLKVLRAVIASNAVDRPFPEHIVDDLFAIYRRKIWGSGLELSVFSHHTQNEGRLAKTSKGHEEAGERGCPLSPLSLFFCPCN